MVKLQYNGVMANGMAKCGIFKQIVKRGEIYDIPSEIAKKLLENGEWNEVKTEKKAKTKIKETDGGNKKW